LEKNGAELRALVDVEGKPREGTEAVSGAQLKAHGRTHVSALSFERRGRRKKVACDGIIVCVPASPAFELARQGGAKVAWSDAHMTFVVEADESGRTSAPRVVVCGEQAGPSSIESSAKSGERAAELI